MGHCWQPTPSARAKLCSQFSFLFLSAGRRGGAAVPEDRLLMGKVSEGPCLLSISRPILLRSWASGPVLIYQVRNWGLFFLRGNRPALPEAGPPAPLNSFRTPRRVAPLATVCPVSRYRYHRCRGCCPCFEEAISDQRPEETPSACLWAPRPWPSPRDRPCRLCLFDLCNINSSKETGSSTFVFRLSLHLP